MTRFARARGSKASNERTPEDSTPWEIMKDQLLQAKKNSDESKMREEAEQKRIENYENFLKDRKVQKRKATWCDFPESVQNDTSVSGNNKIEPPGKKKKNKKKSKTEEQELDGSNVDNNTEINVNDVVKKSKKKKKPQPAIESQDASQEASKTTEPKEIEVSEPVQSKKKNKKNKQKTQNSEQNESLSNPQSDNTQNSNETNNNNSKKNPKQNQKNKKNKQKTQSLQQNETLPNPQSDNRQNSNGTNKNNNSEKNPKQNQNNKKNKKLIDGKPVRRKEINDRSFQLIINGKDIELVRYDGFPVMKKDADRLEELKNSMIKKGIPKSEVQRTMKLERRRAEKALARVKRDVCYNCRKGGHVLSDCPELKSKIPGTDGADGVCFKCGSTEHRQFECKVQRDKEFRFATCFICKEPGHIARQCPDNPKGLYPNGGNCKLCGDVTHLRKDCPTVMDKKEGSTVKLQTLDSGENIEDVGQQTTKFTPTETSKKPKKIMF